MTACLTEPALVPDRIRRRFDTSHMTANVDALERIGCVTTAELLAELADTAQVLADARGLNVTLVRELLLEWEVHRPIHP